MFIYESDEKHSVGDKPGHYRRRTVKLRDHKGTKTESYYNGSKVGVKHTEPLTAAEVKAIRTRKFTPGLFDICTVACQNKTAKKRSRAGRD